MKKQGFRSDLTGARVYGSLSRCRPSNGNASLSGAAARAESDTSIPLAGITGERRRARSCGTRRGCPPRREVTSAGTGGISERPFGSVQTSGYRESPYLRLRPILGRCMRWQRAPYDHVAFATTRRVPPVATPPLVGRRAPLPFIRILSDVQPERVRQQVQVPEGFAPGGPSFPIARSCAIPHHRRTPTRRASAVESRRGRPPRALRDGSVCVQLASDRPCIPPGRGISMGVTIPSLKSLATASNRRATIVTDRIGVMQELKKARSLPGPRLGGVPDLPIFVTPFLAHTRRRVAIISEIR